MDRFRNVQRSISRQQSQQQVTRSAEDGLDCIERLKSSADALLRQQQQSATDGRLATIHLKAAEKLNASLEQQLRQAVATNEELSTKLTVEQRRVDELLVEIAGVTATRSVVDQSVTTLREATSNTEVMHQRVSQRLAQWESIVADAMNRLEAAELAIPSLTSERDNALREVAQTAAQIDAYRDRQNALQEQLQRLQSAITMKDADLAGLQRENGQLGHDLRQSEANVTQLQAVIETLNSRIRDIECNMRELRVQYDDLSAQDSILAANKEEIQQKLRRTEVELGNEKQNALELSTQLENERLQHTQTLDELNRTRANEQAVLSQLQASESTTTQMRRDVGNLSRDLTSALSDIATRDEQIVAQGKRIADLESLVGDMNSLSEKLHQEQVAAADLREVLSETQRLLELANDAKSELETRYTDQSQQLVLLQSQLSDSNSRVAELTCQYASAEDRLKESQIATDQQITSLQQQLAESKERLGEVRSELERARDSQRTTEEKLQSVIKALDQRQEELVAVRAEESAKGQEIQALRAELEEQTQRMTQLKARLDVTFPGNEVCPTGKTPQLPAHFHSSRVVSMVTPAQPRQSPHHTGRMSPPQRSPDEGSIAFDVMTPIHKKTRSRGTSRPRARKSATQRMATDTLFSDDIFAFTDS